MKARHTILGTIIVFIVTITWNPTSQTANNILGMLFFLGITLSVYLIIRNIFCAIKSIITKGSTKNQTSRKLQNIDRALDEIESTLDAMTEAGQEDGKITPIWGAGTKKDR